jgi:hypothetical protein
MSEDQRVLLQIAKDMATNTEATKNIERHLRELNGKVATQESFTRTLQTTVELHTSIFEKMNEEQKKREENRSRLNWLTVENVFKFVFALAIAWLLWLAGPGQAT